jgi:hypothetical protein
VNGLVKLDNYKINTVVGAIFQGFEGRGYLRCLAKRLTFKELRQ